MSLSRSLVKERAIRAPERCNFACLRAPLRLMPRAASNIRPAQIKPREV